MEAYNRSRTKKRNVDFPLHFFGQEWAWFDVYVVSITPISTSSFFSPPHIIFLVVGDGGCRLPPDGAFYVSQVVYHKATQHTNFLHSSLQIALSIDLILVWTIMYFLPWGKNILSKNGIQNIIVKNMNLDCSVLEKLLVCLMYSFVHILIVLD